MRAPTVDELMDLVALVHQPGGDDALRGVVSIVRDAMLLTITRARANAGAGQRARRRRSLPRQHRELAIADREVLERVARFTRVPVGTLLAQDRSQSAARARFVAMWVLRHGRKRSWPEVAAVVRRTTSAVINGARRVDAQVAADPALGAKLRRLAAA